MMRAILALFAILFALPASAQVMIGAEINTTGSRTPASPGATDVLAAGPCTGT